MRKAAFSLIAMTVLAFAALPLWREIPYAEALAQKGATAMVSILERRFERPRIEDWSGVTGLVVLGGNPPRYKEAFRLAEAYPHLRIVISGPSDYEMHIIARASPEVRARIVLEQKSLSVHRNTYGNAVFAAELIRPAPGERWLLVTSASHMPRAIGTFHKAGFPVEPWPVLDGAGNLDYKLRVALHEWFGLIAYRLLGRTDALLPG